VNVARLRLVARLRAHGFTWREIAEIAGYNQDVLIRLCRGNSDYLRLLDYYLAAEDRETSRTVAALCDAVISREAESKYLKRRRRIAAMRR